MKGDTRKFRGYAVIERPDGKLIWGTFRPAQADAWAAYSRNNPTVDGHPPHAQLAEVEIMLRPITE